MSRPVWLSRLLSLFSWERLDGELADEIAAHLDEAERDLRAGGMAPEEARRVARLHFGGVERVREQYRDQRGLPWVESLWQDIRYTLQSLKGSPVFVVLAVLSLALGIGANTAIFSLFEQLMLRTLRVENPRELVYLYSEGPWQGSMSSDEDGGPSFSYPMFRALQQEQTPFAGLAAARNQTGNVVYEGQASYTQIRLVSGNYFSLLGVAPALGRVVDEADDQVGAQGVVVLGHRHWASRFGADPGVLNRSIQVNGAPMTIIGVAAEGFASERTGVPPDLYVPVTKWIETDVNREGLGNRRYAWLTLVARLKPGMTVERAEVEINVPYRAQVEVDAELLNQTSARFLEEFRSRKIRLEPGQYGRGGLRKSAASPLTLMGALTLLVLLLTCANVANLQLARGAARMRDAAVRLAMGASRLRLIRLLLLESWALALAGGVAGLGVAYLTSKTLIEATPSWRGVEYMASATPSGRALLFCVALCWLAGLAFGVFPALKVSGVSVSETLKAQAGQISLPRSVNAFRNSMAALQVAITVLLLIVFGLFLATLTNVMRADLGIRTDHLATFSVFPRMNHYEVDEIAELDQRLLERLRAIPGVVMVTASHSAAVAGGISATRINIEGEHLEDDDRPSVHVSLVGDDYFRTMGIPLVRGRELDIRDDAQGPLTAVVNEAFVREYLSDRDPLGAGIETNNKTLQIVGVVKDAVYSSMREEPPATFYRPMR
ncbi:MAG: ABC transporter permease, partial [Acidobacteria bacterium]|nr:ABC transporter permease [Acidobacteriota bacterium]